MQLAGIVADPVLVLDELLLHKYWGFPTIWRNLFGISRALVTIPVGEGAVLMALSPLSVCWFSTRFCCTYIRALFTICRALLAI